MDTIEEYKIIESGDVDSLTAKVSKALNEGWQPHGGPSIHGSGMAVAVCRQAVVKFHQPTPEGKIVASRTARR